MPLTLNSALNGLVPSGIRRFSTLAAATPGCVSLTLGEPGEQTSDAIKASVVDDLAAGLTHYPPNNGIAALRDAIAAHESGRGIPCEAEQVVVTNGATEALFSILSALLDPGDQVIIPTPAFGLYESIVRLLRAEPVFLDTSADGFQIARDRLAACVTPRTKAIVLNSPNNPTGCVLDPSSLDAVADAALAHDFFVVCDDVYNQLVYDGSYQHICVRRPELLDRAVLADSLSKPHAMTGWRLGWAAAPKRIAPEVAKVHQYAVSCLPAFTQGAAVVALSEDVEPMRRMYQARRDLVVRSLAKMGLSAPRPSGAFYAFPRIDGLGMGSEEFCERAIAEAGVALVPGVFFGSDAHVRLSFACDDATLEEGLSRLARFVGGLA